MLAAAPSSPHRFASDVTGRKYMIFRQIFKVERANSRDRSITRHESVNSSHLKATQTTYTNH